MLSDRTFLLILPNGKETFGHLAKALRSSGTDYSVDEIVAVEMTPYDFSKARIVGRVPREEGLES